MGVPNCLGKENKNTMHIIYKKWKDKFQNRERQDANNMRIWVVTSNINILFIRLTYPCVSTKKKLALVIISKNFVFVFVFSFNHLNLLQKNMLTICKSGFFFWSKFKRLKKTKTKLLDIITSASFFFGWNTRVS